VDQFNVTNEKIQERNSIRADRRHNQRRRALKAALIVFQNGYCDIKCHVLDFSDTGALLKPADVLQCPNQFVLKPASGPSRNCEVVWRGGTTVGVRYCDCEVPAK
jgi:hypothetical protein